ncbi:hypothetical protein [Sporomusa sp.]|uniref:hypothetical protein n=1 Tax=Sporomusa sp. TaxID=2078658 RepID=UPI002C38E109|nr:hypothetical protein [Sporomusa sp.]HWR42800.1 hypothetical protein [Sporomusa sp.]
MDDSSKGDPSLRVVLIVFAGLLVFGFLFGFNFGGTGYAGPGNIGHNGMADGYGGGYYGGGGAFLGGIIPGLIGLLMNILILVLVFALIAGLVMGARKFINQPDGLVQSSKDFVQSSKNFVQSSKTMEYINQDPVLKTMAIVIAAIFGFYFITALFRSLEFGGGLGYGASPQFMLFGLIGFLVKLLMIALVVTLTVALVQYMQTQFFDNQQGGQQPAQAEVINGEPAAQPAQLSTPPAFNQNGNKPGDKNDRK